MHKSTAALLILFACACSGSRELPKPSATSMALTSPAFAPNGEIPRKYTCDGDAVSPPLRVTGLPPQAKSLALIVDDPDAPGGTFTHWIVWNMKADRPVIDEGHKPDGAQEGRNDFGKDGWGAPCPPSGEHRYVFHLYALDDRISTKPTRAELERTMKPRVIAETELVGRYRKR
jgi:Raf kinase inhibitor-like YbhB/YbcL family protein